MCTYVNDVCIMFLASSITVFCFLDLMDEVKPSTHIVKNNKNITLLNFLCWIHMPFATKFPSLNFNCLGKSYQQIVLYLLIIDCMLIVVVYFQNCST